MTGLWGVGSYDDGAGRVAWEISHDEMQRDIGSATTVLRDLGIGPGDRVLWCSRLSEAGQFWPFVLGTVLVGARVSSADATTSDAARVAMFLRQLEYRAVMGVDDAVLDGLDELGLDAREVFGAVPLVGARAGAYERLVACGLAPCHVVLCGPAVAVARAPGGPARLDAAEWRAEASGGRITVTSRNARATRFDRTRTAIRGDVRDGGTEVAVRASAGDEQGAAS